MRKKNVPPDGSSRTGSRTMFFVRAQLVLLLAWSIVSPSPNGAGACDLMSWPSALRQLSEEGLAQKVAEWLQQHAQVGRKPRNAEHFFHPVI